MFINEILYEAPLADFDMIGDPDQEGSFRPDDLRKFRDPLWRQRIINAFKRTPYKFNIYMLNGAEGRVGLGGYSELEVRDLRNLKKYVGINPMSVVARFIGKEPPDVADSITVLMVENEGTNRVSMTPWMLAHRVAHVMLYSGQEERDQNFLLRKNAVSNFFSGMSSMINIVGDVLKGSQHFSHLNWSTGSEKAAEVARIVGKMRSARTGNLTIGSEFYVETIAQYLVTGAVSFNHPEVDDKGRNAVDPAQGIIPEGMVSLARVVDSGLEFVDRLKDYQTPQKPTPHFAIYDANGVSLGASTRDDPARRAPGTTAREVKPSRYQIKQYNRQVKKRQNMIDQWNDWKSLGLLDWVQAPNTQTSQLDRHLDHYEKDIGERIEAILKMCVGKALIL